MVEFRVLGDDFLPDIITEKLSICPSKTWFKGDKISNREMFRQYSCWMLNTGYIESLDVNEQIEEIILKLTDKQEILQEIKEEFDVAYRIDIVINIEKNEKPAIFLDTRIIDFTHSINTVIDFDLHIYSQLL